MEDPYQLIQAFTDDFHYLRSYIKPWGLRGSELFAEMNQCWPRLVPGQVPDKTNLITAGFRYRLKGYPYPWANNTTYRAEGCVTSELFIWD